jgi:hypothetical protein
MKKRIENHSAARLKTQAVFWSKDTVRTKYRLGWDKTIHLKNDGCVV